MKASAPSRVVTISSLSHIKVHMDFRDLNSVDDYEARFAYLRSKLANILFTKELAARLKGESQVLSPVQACTLACMRTHTHCFVLWLSYFKLYVVYNDFLLFVKPNNQIFI